MDETHRATVLQDAAIFLEKLDAGEAV